MFLPPAWRHDTNSTLDKYLIDKLLFLTYKACKASGRCLHLMFCSLFHISEAICRSVIHVCIIMYFECILIRMVKCSTRWSFKCCTEARVPIWYKCDILQRHLNGFLESIYSQFSYEWSVQERQLQIKRHSLKLCVCNV